MINDVPCFGRAVVRVDALGADVRLMKKVDPKV